MKILYLAQVNSWEKAYIKVTYKHGFINEGIYNNIKDLKMAISAFTEKELVKDFC